MELKNAVDTDHKVRAEIDGGSGMFSVAPSVVTLQKGKSPSSFNVVFEAKEGDNGWEQTLLSLFSTSATPSVSATILLFLEGDRGKPVAKVSLSALPFVALPVIPAELQFDHIIIGRVVNRSFQISNPSLLPLSFSITTTSPLLDISVDAASSPQEESGLLFILPPEGKVTVEVEVDGKKGEEDRTLQVGSLLRENVDISFPLLASLQLLSPLSIPVSGDIVGSLPFNIDLFSNVSFPTTATKSESMKSLVLENVAGIPIEYSIHLEDGGERVEEGAQGFPFSLTKSSNGIVNANETLGVPICFRPVAEGLFRADAVISTQQGVFRAPITALSATASVSIHPSTINFGVVGMGSPRQEVMKLKNMSSQRLLLSYSIPNEFAPFLSLDLHKRDVSFQEGEMLGYLEGDDEVSVTMAYNPGHADTPCPPPLACYVRFFLDGIVAGEVGVSAAAAQESLSLSPPSLSFGRVGVGLSHSQFVFVRNTGGSDLHLLFGDNSMEGQEGGKGKGRRRGSVVAGIAVGQGPVDVSFEPPDAVILPGQRQKVKVTIYVNVEGTHRASLSVRLKGSANGRKWPLGIAVEGTVMDISPSIAAILADEEISLLQGSAFGIDEDVVEAVVGQRTPQVGAISIRGVIGTKQISLLESSDTMLRSILALPAAVDRKPGTATDLRVRRRWAERRQSLLMSATDPIEELIEDRARIEHRYRMEGKVEPRSMSRAEVDGVGTLSGVKVFDQLDASIQGQRKLISRGGLPFVDSNEV
uniref:Abnormal spindle-like microcephaly-associated protein ASH domain-containing protein n=1 Tax=Palpitomonas bilix TaxID=652834 RepID=A0A7S3G2V3_9EUKA